MKCSLSPIPPQGKNETTSMVQYFVVSKFKVFGSSHSFRKLCEFKAQRHRHAYVWGCFASIAYYMSGMLTEGLWVGQICDPVLALCQRFDSHSQSLFCCNTLGKGINWELPSLLRCDLKQFVYITLHWLHTHKIPLFKKRVGHCDQSWWMTVHQHMNEENLLKPTKICSLKNGLWLLKYVESL